MRKLLILGIALFLSYSTIAYSATGYVDPIGDDSPLTYGIQPATPTTHYTKIDDGIRQPTAGDSSDYIQDAVGVGLNPTDVFIMSTITNVSTITNITVWAYGNKSSTIGSPYIVGNILMNGTWTTETDFGFTPAGTYNWKSVSFNGNWTQTDLNNIRVKIHSVSPTRETDVASMYVVVTYTAGGGGGSTAPYKIKKKKGIFFIK